MVNCNSVTGLSGIIYAPYIPLHIPPRYVVEIDGKSVDVDLELYKEIISGNVRKDNVEDIQAITDLF